MGKARKARLVQQLKQIRPTDAFRRDAVRRAKSSTKPVRVIARELGIGTSTLYRWMATDPGVPKDADATASCTRRKASAEGAGREGTPGVTDTATEVDRLRREIVFLREENDILRRAAMAFARSTYPVPE